MGGEETEIGEGTRNVLLEAANFEPYTIFRTSERLRLRTEGSNRWEKGVDPYLAPHAARLATQLVAELAGARWTGDTDVKGELPEPPVVHYRTGRANKIVGIEIEEQEQKDILERLGFDVAPGWDVHVPSWRLRDTTREIDLVEEVARVHGLETIPFTLPLRSAMFGRLSKDQRLRRLVEDVLAGAGFAVGSAEAGAAAFLIRELAAAAVFFATAGVSSTFTFFLEGSAGSGSEAATVSCDPPMTKTAPPITSATSTPSARRPGNSARSKRKASGTPMAAEKTTVRSEIQRLAHSACHSPRRLAKSATCESVKRGAPRASSSVRSSG